MAYDNERWLSGKYNNVRQQAVTPEFLLREVRKLKSHLNSTGRYRVNEALLVQYLEYLLQASHIDILNITGSDNRPIVETVVQCVSQLPYPYSREIYSRLRSVNTGGMATGIIENSERKSLRRYRLQRLQPWIIMLITLLVLVAMYCFCIKHD